MGIPGHGEDFGQTLAVWGVGEGPYLVLPFLGPSNPRDASGLAVDVGDGPHQLYSLQAAYLVGRRGAIYFTVLDLRGQTYQTIQGIQRSSVDYYASLRSLYRQLRDNEIRNGRPPKPRICRISEPLSCQRYSRLELATATANICSEQNGSTHAPVNDPARRALLAMAGSGAACRCWRPALAAGGQCRPRAFVDDNIHKGLDILNNKPLSTEQRRDQFESFLLGLTDMKRIAISPWASIAAAPARPTSTPSTPRSRIMRSRSISPISPNMPARP